MQRCGFDAFVLRADQDAEEALGAFAELGSVKSPGLGALAA